MNSIGRFRDHLFRDESSPSAPLFVKRPEVLLTDYAAQREACPLGRVFQVANGLHDYLDAVVVVGCDESIAGIRAITDACCDRYHNELSRADRGSKPRLYFAGSRCENDVTSSLLNRLINGGKGGTEAENRFAIIVVGYPEKEAGVQSALPHLIDALKTVLGQQVDEWLPRLVIPMCHSQSRLHELLHEIPLASSFELPSSNDPFRDVLSPVGLLPAAFLGLDCMKLLEGAYAITEQFRTAEFQDNLVMQYVATAQTFDCDLPNGRSVHNWNPALDSLEQWDHSLGWNHERSQRYLPEHWSTLSARTDSLFEIRHGTDHETNQPCSMDQLNQSAIMDAIEKSLAGSPTTTAGAARLTLPLIDTYGIGQWMQLLMLAEHASTHNLGA